MNKRLKQTLTAISAMLLMSVQASAWSIDGQLGVMNRGYDTKSDGQFRLGEYKSLPKDGSLSLFGAHSMKASQNLRFEVEGANLGEDDAEGSLYLGIGRKISLEVGADRITHRIDGADLFTSRDTGDFALNIGLLSRLSLKVTGSSEDKIGEVANNVFVGDKTERGGIEAKLALGNLVGEVGLANEELQNNEASYDMDEMTAYAQYAPAADTFNSVTYSVKEYAPSRNNKAASMDLNRMDITDYRTFTKNISLSSVYSLKERDNDTAGALSFEDVLISSRLNVKTGCGDLSVLYKNTERDYTNATVNNHSVDQLKVAASTKVSFLGIKAAYEHGYRDVNDAKPKATNSNFTQRSAEFANYDYSVSLLGFSKFGMTLFSKRDSSQYRALTKWGTSSSISKIDGFSSYYVPDESLVMTLNLYQTENLVSSRQKFVYENTSWDTRTNAIDNSNLFQVGMSYVATKSTTLSLDYTSVWSDVLDIHDNNSIDERVLSLGAEHELSKDLSLNVGLTLNKYRDDLDSTISSSNKMLEVELIKEF